MSDSARVSVPEQRIVAFGPVQLTDVHRQPTVGSTDRLDRTSGQIPKSPCRQFPGAQNGSGVAVASSRRPRGISRLRHWPSFHQGLLSIA